MGTLAKEAALHHLPFIEFGNALFPRVHVRINPAQFSVYPNSMLLP
jgi:hypothetical protein